MAAAQTDSALVVEGLGKRFGEVVALEDVAFEAPTPGLLAVLGPNGAGKTTLLDILEGLAPPSSGSFRLFGSEPAPYPRRRVGVVMQNEAKPERVTAGEYADLFSAIYRVKDGRERILERARLRDRAKQPVARLSGGEAARLFIATSVVHDPELVFLDEPTAHLDPESKRLIGEELRALASARTVVMTTHDLAEAEALSDHLLFLVDGRVRASGLKAELLDGRSMEEAFFHYCAVRMRDGEVEGTT